MGMDIQYLWEGGEPYMVDLAFYWGTWKPLRNHVILSYPYKFMSGYLYFPDNLRHKIPDIGWFDKMQNLFQINGFQRKTKVIATLYILQ